MNLQTKSYFLKTFFFFIALSMYASSNEAFSQEYWSNPATWGGNIPNSGDQVTIDSGRHIILDVSTPNLAGLIVKGTLEFDRADLNLTADYVVVAGTLRIGSESNLFQQKATITLTGLDPQNINGMGTRGILVMGNLELHGAVPNSLYTRLGEHATAGSNSIILSQNAGWNAGDEIVISPTDYYAAGNGASQTQRTEIASVNGPNIMLTSNLNAHRWGLLQYVQQNGLSTSPGTPPTLNADQNSTPLILDERAVVANISRNIIIQSIDDAAWQQDGFGAHIMMMGKNSVCHVEGIQIRRCGQAGHLARYPMHFHLKSYNGTNWTGDASQDYFHNSSIIESAQRGIVLHGTNGVSIRKNILSDIRGHAIFTEDAVERRNNIDSNVVMHVRNPQPGDVLKNYETGEFGASGYWISNPDNALTNNIAADCEGNGFWLAFPVKTFGLNANVVDDLGQALRPNRLLFGQFERNIAFSNRKDGIHIDNPEVDELGNFYPLQYSSTINGREPQWDDTTRRRFDLIEYQVWKNGTSGIWDRAVWPSNLRVISADNCGRFFAGSGSDGLIKNALVIGTSLNHMMNGTDRPTFTQGPYANQTPAAFATYHSTFDIRDNVVVNFAKVSETRSGAFSTEDYYLRPVDKGQIRNINNLLINSFPGVKLKADYAYYSLAGALWDPNGNWTGQPGNGYFVYDEPFFTYGQTPTVVGAGAGGVVVQGPFYGVNEFVINQANPRSGDLMAIDVRRQDNQGNEVGSWVVNTAQQGWALDHMRHFAAHPSSAYVLSFPDIDTVSDVGFSIDNMLTDQDSLLLGIEYSGRYAVEQVFLSSYYNYFEPNHTQAPTFSLKEVYRQVSSKDSLIKGTYFQDTVNNIVWVALQGGMRMNWNPNAYGEFSDEKLYREFNFRIWGTRKPDLPNPGTGMDNPLKEMRVYPTPSNQTVFVETNSPSTEKIEVIDQYGRNLTPQLLITPDAGSYKINVETLANGIYYLRIAGYKPSKLIVRH